MTSPTFASLGLSKTIQRAVSAANYTKLTPIQSEAIPAQLKGRDVLGIAQTGTGKTAAFVLPLLHHLTQNRQPPTQRTTSALVLAPTRELAMQIGESISVYGSQSGLRQTVITGGVGHQRQINQLKNGLDILVATPGRLMDLIDQKQLSLSNTTHLVLDEADRMLDIGFIRDVRKIAKLVARPCQTVLFSATMPKSVQGLANEILTDPIIVEARAKSVAADKIDQQVHHLGASEKNARLCDLLSHDSCESVIIFVRTKRRADRVARVLGRRGIKNSAIHGDKSQNNRRRALEQFKRGKIKALVATDVASRGIDVAGVTHVINFDLPDDTESYVHRIGRTARAGHAGTAISFCTPDDTHQLLSIEKLIGRRLTVARNSSEEHRPHTERDPVALAREPRATQKPRRPRRRSRKRAA